MKYRITNRREGEFTETYSFRKGEDVVEVYCFSASGSVIMDMGDNTEKFSGVFDSDECIYDWEIEDTTDTEEEWEFLSSSEEESKRLWEELDEGYDTEEYADQRSYLEAIGWELMNHSVYIETCDVERLH